MGLNPSSGHKLPLSPETIQILRIFFLLISLREFNSTNPLGLWEMFDLEHFTISLVADSAEMPEPFVQL